MTPSKKMEVFYLEGGQGKGVGRRPGEVRWERREGEWRRGKGEGSTGSEGVGARRFGFREWWEERAEGGRSGECEERHPRKLHPCLRVNALTPSLLCV